MKNIFSRREVRWLVVLGVLGLVSYLSGLDYSMAEYFMAQDTSTPLHSLFLFFSYQYFILYLLVSGVILYRMRKLWGFDSLLTSLIVLFILHMAISSFMPRDRPLVEDDAVKALIIQLGMSSSFFSYHTASVVAICTIFLEIGYCPQTAILLGVPIIISRLTLSHHYLSDIIGGIIIGYIVTVFLSKEAKVL
jgi:membrane-associated phospholipid phosphatase